MTTNHVVADGITKRKPTAEESELFFGTRLPELVKRFVSGGVDPNGVNVTLKQVSDGVIIAASREVVVAPPKPKADKFELLTTFEITVPNGYVHATRLDTFCAAHQKEFYFYNDALTDANFSKATVQLTPGRKFLVKALGIKSKASSLDCLAKVKAENGRLTGAQGASLVYEQRKDELPKGKCYVSFDEKDALWQDPLGRYRAPYVRAHSIYGFYFALGHFEYDWDSDYVLLCFCDLPKSSEA